MRAIGKIQPLDGLHFVERPSLLSFLDTLITVLSTEEAFRCKGLRVSLPSDLRSMMMLDLPPNMTLVSYKPEIKAPTATAMLESLMTLVMQNDLDRLQARIEPFAPRTAEDN